MSGKVIGVLFGIGVVGVLIWYFMRRSATTPISQLPDGTVVPYGTGGERTVFSGQSFVTKQSKEDTDAAAAGATAYDINDPAVQQRRADALARAARLQQIADAQGLTTDQTYQLHLQQSLTAQQTELQIATQVATSKGYTAPPSPPPGAPPGADPNHNNQNLYAVLTAAGPPIDEPAPPGQAWNYATQRYEPLIF